VRLARVRLRNFRCYKDETSIDIDSLTVLIGKNDAGKSAVMDALDVFFNEAKLDADDASKSGDKSDVRLICEFEDFPESPILDVDYPTTLREEYLLNAEGRLEIHKVYDGALKNPKLTGVFARALHPSAPGRSDLLLLKNKELKERATELGLDTDNIDLKVNAQIRRLIWNSASDLNLKAQEISLEKETGGRIWDQLKKYLPSFALFKSDRPSTDQDAEAQDPMKAAVREALRAKQDDLAQIEEYVRREVCAIAEQTVAKLRQMDPTLAGELNPRFAPPKWDAVFKMSLTGEEEIPINKRGSGVRRLILLNFFQAKAEQIAVDRGAPSVIYALEEPETCQHPNMQKMLMRALYELSEYPDCQVILSTHTPVLARQVPINSLRYIAIQDSGRRTVHSGNQRTNALVAKALGVLPDHDVKLFIGVEGINDVNFLRGISRVLRVNGEDVPDLGGLEDDGTIIFFPLGGENLAHWTSRLARLNRPEFYVFDTNEEPPAVSKYEKLVAEINARPGNCLALLTGKKEMENYLHPGAINAVRPEIDIAFGDFDDVPSLVAEAVHQASGADVPWAQLSDKKRAKKVSRAKAWLNTRAVDAMTAAMLDERDTYGDVRGWLAEVARFLEGA
jgi:putative ATP-dependent endonuclease of OLD family